jgi:putative redox protein
MELIIKPAGGVKIEAHFNGFVVCCDQPQSNGGEGSAPDPFAYFLTGIGACAGFYVVRFCQARNLSTVGITLKLRNDWNQDKGAADNIELEIIVPPEFPPKYHSALVRAVNECSVKKTIANMPTIATRIVPLS